MYTTALLSQTTTRRIDRDCQAEATSYVTSLFGRRVARVCWDSTHRLQGHVVVDGHELVVIAARDASHEPLVVTAEDWDEIQHSTGDCRASLLRACRITRTRRRLAA